MSVINNLINNVEDSVVPFLSLREVVAFKNGKGHEQSIVKNGTFIVVNSRYISTNGESVKYSNEQICPVKKDDILMVMSDLPNGKALAKCFVVDLDNKYTLNQRIGCFTNLIPEKIDNKFLFYILDRNPQLLRYDNGIDQTNLKKDDILNIKIPVPSLDVQRGVVRILDRFKCVTAKIVFELNLELLGRKKQYDYYRANLFEKASRIKMTRIDSIFENRDSERKPVTSSNRKAGIYPYYGASGIVDYVDDYLFEGDFLLVSEDGANLLARSTPIAFSISGKNWVNNHAHILHVEDPYTRKYVEYYLNSIDLSKYISGAAQPKLNQANLNSILIPLPAQEERIRIVKLLDSFTLFNENIKKDILAEIVAHQKQYEYYRDKLLSFKELTK